MSDSQNNTVAQDENKLVAERRAKLKSIRETADVAFPNDFRPENKALDLQAKFGELSKEQLEADNNVVSVAGRLQSCPVHQSNPCGGESP